MKLYIFIFMIVHIITINSISARTIEEIRTLASELKQMELKDAKARLSELSTEDAEAVYSIYSAEVQNNINGGSVMIMTLESVSSDKATRLAQLRVDHLTYVVVFIMLLLSGFFTYIFIQQRKVLISLQQLNLNEEQRSSEVYRG